MKKYLFVLLLTSCSQFSFSHGSANLVESAGPFFTLECRDVNGCNKFAAEYCPNHRSHMVGKKTNTNLNWYVEYTCESRLVD
jgi:hypothetical protein